MGTMVGRQYSPEKADGTRDVIHPETQIDAVLDPVTGVPLRDQLKDITDTLLPVNVNSDKPGLITPEMAKQFATSAANAIITSEKKPDSEQLPAGGYWFNIYNPNMTSVDPE